MVPVVLSLLVLLSLSWSVVGKCVVPVTQVCNVAYQVPQSIAALASVLESEIASAYNSDKAQSIGEACAQSLKEVRCAKSFPRCSNDSTNVTVTSLDCQQRLLCATSTYRNILLTDHFCDLAEETFPLAGCKPATQYGYTFRICPADVYSKNVSQWMFALMRYQDIYLSSAIGPGAFLAQNYPNCATSYGHFQCARIGQCDGCATDTVVNYAYTREQCNASSLQNLSLIIPRIHCNCNGYCSFATVEEEKMVVSLYAVFAAVAFLFHVTTIVIIVKTKTFKLFLHRLTLYLTIGGVLRTVAYVLQVLAVNIDLPGV
eukprot:Em0013g1091a